MDGELASVPAPHASRLLQRLVGELDADLLVLEQLPEDIAELGGVVEQARISAIASPSDLRAPRVDAGEAS